MARRLSGRIVVRGTLVAVDPLHVGSGEEDHATDLALSVDGQGRVVAAGTGLAGALRAWCVRRYDKAVVNRLWGFQIDDEGHASFLQTADAVIHSPEGVELLASDLVEVRDHVGIDREHGAAAHHIKFDRAVLPPGSTLALELTLDLPEVDPLPFRGILWNLLKALKNGDIRIGAAKTRGLGRVRLLDSAKSSVSSLNISERNWGLKSLCQQLRGTLPSMVPSSMEEEAAKWSPKAVDRLVVQVEWEPRQPTFVKSGLDGLLVDTLPLLGRTGGSMAPLIPGSSLKGVLRSRAEMILRTVLKRDSAWRAQADSRVRFLAQLDEGLPLIHELFGARGTHAGSDHLGMGALSVADCFSQTLHSEDAWASLTFASVPGHATESDRYKAIEAGKAAVGREQWHVASHNAIDRWTNAVAGNALYQVLEPHQETNWAPFEFELDMDRVSSSAETQQATLTLLLLTLRDFARGRVTIGFGGTRGLGEVAVRRISLIPVEGTPAGLTKQIDMDQGWEIHQVPTASRNNWTSAWSAVCSAASSESCQPSRETVHA